MTGDTTTSIVVTTYYRNDALRRAVESCLDQTHDAVEVIVVDDSGARHAAPVCDAWEDVRYVPHARNEGQIAAWQTGFDAASGAYVQFLDDDDVLRPEKVTAQLDVLRSADGVGFVGCGIEWDDGATSLPAERLRNRPLESGLSFRTYPCTTSTLLFRRGVLEAVFPLDRYEGATDLPLWIECATRAGFDYVARPLVRRDHVGTSQGESWAGVDARREMLEDYREQYAAVPERIYRRAKADVAMKTGHRLLEDDGWSLRATASFVRSVYHWPSSRAIKLTVLSLGGRPGRDLGRAFARDDYPTVASTIERIRSWNRS